MWHSIYTICYYSSIIYASILGFEINFLQGLGVVLSIQGGKHLSPCAFLKCHYIWFTRLFNSGLHRRCYTEIHLGLFQLFPIIHAEADTTAQLGQTWQTLTNKCVKTVCCKNDINRVAPLLTFPHLHIISIRRAWAWKEEILPQPKQCLRRDGTLSAGFFFHKITTSELFFC